MEAFEQATVDESVDPLRSIMLEDALQLALATLKPKSNSVMRHLYDITNNVTPTQKEVKSFFIRTIPKKGVLN